ncbi:MULTISPECIES: hypothetical protein [Nostocales]|jgi:hypothetical protein|uniref:Uncharacterized protein n=1 Tax=Dolichospermum flos-aquae UHCC 0037 TaxID=2590026 RepID=A0ACC7S0E3_DOLFA|nr:MULTISPECIES: hypothetical protein [Nostocales]ALB40450.1 hypothetical protein AA650_08145 [Anabaena sp. WA102]MBO1064047.1 hypothetical protein [Anabaena sp. 54]MTJ41915.1 hypothetical protein [Dolichospermum flos-aquae UHCC 0037]
MQKQYIYSILGLFVGAFINVIFNLIAAAIQQRTIGEKFNNQTIWWMAIFATLGLLVGYWLSLKSESSNKAKHQGGIRGRRMKSKKGRFRAEESTGQGIDLEDVEAEGDVDLIGTHLQNDKYRNSIHSILPNVPGSIDANSLNAGGNIAIFNGSLPLAEQLNYFQDQLNISSSHPDSYPSARLQSYWNIWRKLQLLRLAGEELWKGASENNIMNFSQLLNEILLKLDESAIFFEEEEYMRLREILNVFGNFRLGKIRLIDIRNEEDLYRISSSQARRQIERNLRYKCEYEELLDKIRVSFRDRLRC